jgi:hypothetical protein
MTSLERANRKKKLFLALSLKVVSGRAIAQAISRRLPRSGHVGFMVDKLALGMFTPSTSVSPANFHSTNCSILIYHPGLVQ